MPLTFSVVIPTFNQDHFIEQTLCSLRSQGDIRPEIIIVDGGESSWLKTAVDRYRDLDVTLISEKDEGQSDAINKGMRLAKGDVVSWLNSDDMLMPRALEYVRDAFESAEAISLVYGACICFDESKQFSYLPPLPEFDRAALMFWDYLVQPSTFWTRELWEKAGELRTDLHFGMDWEWFIRASRHARFHRIEPCLSMYRLHSDHKTGTGGEKRRAELLSVVEESGDAYAQELWSAIYPVAARLDRVLRRLRGRNLGALRRAMFPGLYRRFNSRHIDLLLDMLR